MPDHGNSRKYLAFRWEPLFLVQLTLRAAFIA